MKKKNFNKVKPSEKKERLYKIVSSRTNGELSAEEIKKIVKSTKTSAQYTIKVVKDASEMKSLIAVENQTFKNDYEISGVEVRKKILIGNCEFANEIPTFDATEKLVVSVKVERWYMCKKNVENSNTYYAIYIYLP